MKEKNPLDSFQTGNYSGFKEPAMPEVCPTLPQATVNPLKMIDYISCHKFLVIVIFAILALLFYSGVKAKVASDNASGGKGGPATPPKK